jgi:hypothetical protein
MGENTDNQITRRDLLRSGLTRRELLRYGLSFAAVSALSKHQRLSARATWSNHYPTATGVESPISFSF